MYEWYQHEFVGVFVRIDKESQIASVCTKLFRHGFIRVADAGGYNRDAVVIIVELGDKLFYRVEGADYNGVLSACPGFV